MRALIQRVLRASVTVDGELVARIGAGMLVLVGAGQHDTPAEAEKLAAKVIRLRIFPDGKAKMNLSVRELSGELLIVSQFTLYGNTSRGNRPSFSEAASPEIAESLYEHFVSACRSYDVSVATGIFRAHMQVELVNEGPVTIMCYSD